ncbi:MAG: hypothetical protein ACETWG_03595, partial [Candidatus Neomarinimicrobiota bacterium]
MKPKLIGLLIMCLAGVGLVWGQETITIDPGENQISATIAAGGIYAGDILELNEGVFTETDTVATPNFRITIRGAEGATVKWIVPDSVDALYACGDLIVENIIFETDTTTPWIYMPSPSTGEDSLAATANSNYGISVHATDPINVFVDQCQFIGFGMAIFADDVGCAGGVCTLDTLQVTNSLIYGGPRYKTGMGICTRYGTSNVLIVENCTFWKIEGESMRCYGPEFAPNDWKAYIDHCTFADAGYPDPSQGYPELHPTGDGLGIYFKYTSADDIIQNCIFYDISDFAIAETSFNPYMLQSGNCSDPVKKLVWKCCMPDIFSEKFERALH